MREHKPEEQVQNEVQQSCKYHGAIVKVKWVLQSERRGLWGFMSQKEVNVAIGREADNWLDCKMHSCRHTFRSLSFPSLHALSSVARRIVHHFLVIYSLLDALVDLLLALLGLPPQPAV